MLLAGGDEFLDPHVRPAVASVGEVPDPLRPLPLPLRLVQVRPELPFRLFHLGLPCFVLTYLVHEIHDRVNNTYQKKTWPWKTADRLGVDSSARRADLDGRHRRMDDEARQSGHGAPGGDLSAYRARPCRRGQARADEMKTDIGVNNGDKSEATACSWH